MKLYREVKENTLNEQTGKFRTETRLEPIEITEEDMISLLEATNLLDEREAARVILSKLKGDVM